MSIVAANRNNPNIALILDVGIVSNIPNISKNKYGTFELGKGTGIIRNTDNNESFVKTLVKIAEGNDITSQKNIGYKSTGGTESDAIQLEKEGFPTANINVSSR